MHVQYIYILLVCLMLIGQPVSCNDYKLTFDQIGQVEKNNELYNWHSSTWENSNRDQILVNLVDLKTIDKAGIEFESMIYKSEQPDYDGKFNGRLIRIEGAKEIDDPQDPYMIIIWKNHFVIDINFLGSPDIGLNFESCCIDQVIENYTKQEYFE